VNLILEIFQHSECSRFYSDISLGLNPIYIELKRVKPWYNKMFNIMKLTFGSDNKPILNTCELSILPSFYKTKFSKLRTLGLFPTEKRTSLLQTIAKSCIREIIFFSHLQNQELTHHLNIMRQTHEKRILFLHMPKAFIFLICIFR
jgi:hypothetical protein